MHLVKGLELRNLAVHPLLPLDVTHPHEIESVAKQVVESGGVNVVFNNAGYGLAGALEGLTDDQIGALGKHQSVKNTPAGVPLLCHMSLRISQKSQIFCVVSG